MEKQFRIEYRISETSTIPKDRLFKLFDKQFKQWKERQEEAQKSANPIRRENEYDSKT